MTRIGKKHFLKGMLFLFLYGCSGGGSSGSGGGAAPAAGSAHIVSVSETGDGRFRVEYFISDASEPCSVELEYSEDHGNTFHRSGNVAGADVVARNSITNDLTWNAPADLGQAPQGDLMVRITPQGEESGRNGLSACSEVFPYGSNMPPEITSCSILVSPAGNPFGIRISALDRQGDTVVLSAALRHDGSELFQPITVTEPASTLLQLERTETTHTMVCDAEELLGEGFFTGVSVKIAVRDSTGSDTASTMGFVLNTCRPSITQTTLEEIPGTMNGSRPFTSMSGIQEDFRLLVPPAGFSFTLSFATDGRGAAIDTSSLLFTLNQPIGPGGEISSGTNLGALFTWDADSSGAGLDIGDNLRLQPGDISCSAEISDQLGNSSEAATCTMAVARPGQADYPFAGNDLWVLMFERDYWGVQSTCTDGDVTVENEFGSNSAADFLEDLALIGLYNFDAPVLSEKAADYVKDRILVQLRLFFNIEPDGTHTEESPSIRFTLNPGGADSAISVGGADPSGGYTLGRAYFDRCNNNRESNTSSTLGVFSTNLIRFYINISYTFKNLFDPFIPGRGDPLGTLDMDPVILGDDFVYGEEGNSEEEDERFLKFREAADGFGRAVAAILAHEIGHSLGLVANGPPPEGLFGGEENASFTGYWTNPHHIDTAGNNIMESSISFSSSQYTGSHALTFNELNRAYLLESILLEK